MKRAGRRAFHFIYKTTCVITDRYYVGMHSTDIIDDGYLGSGKQLGNSIRKHGRENHSREIVEMCESREALRRREEELVDDDLLKDEMCMNLVFGGGDPPDKKSGMPSPLKGRPSPLRGRTLTPEHVAAMKATLNTLEVKEKMSAAKKGVPRPDVSVRMKGRNRGQAWGRSSTCAPLTPEHKIAVSISLMGHEISEETRAKISKTLTGRKMGPRSQETKEKIRRSLLNRQGEQ